MIRQFLIWFVLLIPINAFSEEIKMYLDKSQSKFILVKNQDCSIHKTDYEGNGVGLKFGT